MWQPVLMISGYILGILGLIMCIPAGYEMVAQGDYSSGFIYAAMVSLFFGFALYLGNKTKIERINLKQAYLITIISWLLVCVFAAIPFYLYKVTPNLTDAFFESMAGITGTSASVVADVESLPAAILLWRSLLNGMGGLGIVIFAIALLPFLGIGGMQMFQRENSDSNDKFMPKFSYIAKRIVGVYFVLIGLCCLAYFLCGMNLFDAANHAITTIGTGGFSTKNDSIAGFDSFPIEMVAVIFMMCGAVPMTSYVLLMRGAVADKNGQIRAFLKAVLFCGAVVSIYLYAHSEYSLFYSLRHGFFTTISIMTTTGFSSCDFTQWGGWILAVVLFLSLSGGCTGSTSGSIKILRWQVIRAFLRKYLLAAIEPHRVIPIKIGGLNVAEKVTMSVFVYVFSFIISILIITLLVCMMGVDFSTSIAAVVACITNVGVGAVSSIGPHGNFAAFSAELKLLLGFTMLLGRLEVITVMVVLCKSFWRR